MFQSKYDHAIEQLRKAQDVVRALGVKSEALREQVLAQAKEIERKDKALRDARRFLDYFANDRRSFEGVGTPLGVIMAIDASLSPAAQEAPASHPKES